MIPINMNAIANTDSIRGGFASAETSAIAFETTNTANRLEQAYDFASARPLGWYSGQVLKGIAWVLATLYLVGATVLAGAILYCTFVR
jgi:hypothetical protein